MSRDVKLSVKITANNKSKKNNASITALITCIQHTKGIEKLFCQTARTHTHTYICRYIVYIRYIHIV